VCAEQRVTELFLIARQYTIAMYHERTTSVKIKKRYVYLFQQTRCPLYSNRAKSRHAGSNCGRVCVHGPAITDQIFPSALSRGHIASPGTMPKPVVNPP
jgi:hypothetical protein